MLIGIDPFETETLETLNREFPHCEDFIPHDLAIISRVAWKVSDKYRKQLERALMARARDLAADGWYQSQDRRQRCGLLFHGDGSLWATFRHNREHVTVMVAVEAECIRDGWHPVLDAAKAAAKAAACEWIADLNAKACARAARCTFKSSPMVEANGRKRRAAGVAGAMPYAGEYAMWLLQCDSYKRAAASARAERATAMEAWGESMEGGAA